MWCGRHPWAADGSTGTENDAVSKAASEPGTLPAHERGSPGVARHREQHRLTPESIPDTGTRSRVLTSPGLTGSRRLGDACVAGPLSRSTHRSRYPEELDLAASLLEVSAPEDSVGNAGGSLAVAADGDRVPKQRRGDFPARRTSPWPARGGFVRNGPFLMDRAL